MGKLENVSDPEEKRKIIGGEFYPCFRGRSEKTGRNRFPWTGNDLSGHYRERNQDCKDGKSHHNVGGLPEDLQFELVEPLSSSSRTKFVPAVLSLACLLKWFTVSRSPGPGLGVRCLGAITRDRLEAVRESDAILREEFAKAGLDKKVWQYFTVVPDFKAVGVRDNARSMGYMVVIRAVNTIDAMTASIERIDYDILERICARITAEVPSVSRVCYEITPKPVATIEFE